MGKTTKDPSFASAVLSYFRGLRKFAEQYGDIIRWDQSNRTYVMTHSVSGIDWKHYKHPLPENVYDAYMQYWRGVRLTCEDARANQ